MPASGIRDENVYNNATVNVGTNDSPTINNDGRGVWSLVVRQGGGGTLTFSVLVSVDGTNFMQAGPNLSAVTIGTPQRSVYAVGSTQGPIVEPFIRVRAVVATSNATAVFADLIGQ
jgi:hypothetical protein